MQSISAYQDRPEFSLWTLRTIARTSNIGCHLNYSASSSKAESILHRTTWFAPRPMTIMPLRSIAPDLNFNTLLLVAHGAPDVSEAKASTVVIPGRTLQLVRNRFAHFFSFGQAALSCGLSWTLQRCDRCICQRRPVRTGCRRTYHNTSRVGGSRIFPTIPYKLTRFIAGEYRSERYQAFCRRAESSCQ